MKLTINEKMEAKLLREKKYKEEPNNKFTKKMKKMFKEEGWRYGTK